ncbi:MAG: hypothetical protein AVDCRST_MAG14-1535 [uncultured Rubrobacteraceae bacterium]|uniref:Uncharacterized protein n=1 Tax=uncultured Rubrobacteraceae bacterium TaxID=349277 RepID=A0A6J4QXR8_9ACTN|nr:MAG: hypothetical protein AVDCRST_MAG14-1535 [uncultured Rubrobacteraceae bacterium]
MDGDCEPKYIRVRVGLFGPGERVLIPMGTVAVEQGQRLLVSR